jgi:hypothetical protein
MRIKSFMLFESNDRLEKRIKEISDVYEDIKSIEYILDELGYNLRWKIVTGKFSHTIREGELIRDLVMRNPAFHYDFLKPVRIRIDIPGIGKRTQEAAREDIKRFKNLLEEHLDYLPEESIEFFDGGSYYKIEIKI